MPSLICADSTPSSSRRVLGSTSPDMTSERQRSFPLLPTLILILIVGNLVALLALHSMEGEEPNSLSSYSYSHRALQQQQPVPNDSTISEESTSTTPTTLQDTRLLVAIAAYDFSQLPHLEEVLDGYHDICISGARKVKVVLHTTVAFPVALLDLLQTRFPCKAFYLDVVLELPRIKLHLVDCHRKMFYQHIDDYDVFIYTEDDIRVTPRTVQTYLDHTHAIARKLRDSNCKLKPSDFNVGLVRYEYNFPSNVVMDDTTRHATENVTRVYWEHSSFDPPLIPNAIERVPLKGAPPSITDHYVHMKNHHQGMYLATRSLLIAWKERPGCQFDVASNRPGRPNKPSQPLSGTQRVWMSSQQLYGKNHGCAVQQAIPLVDFGALTVHHLPNKNYRRVGNYRNRDQNKDESVAVSEEALLTALQLHLAMVQAFPPHPRPPADIRMRMYIDRENTPPKREGPPSWKPRLEAFQAYVERGGVLSEQDRQQTSLY